jgi:hypothetical protein
MAGLPRHAVRRKLAARIAYRRNRGFVYHLQSRTLYRAIGQEDNRNRRATSPALIARKLMLLDLVIGESQAEWYVTEAEKVALFTELFRVPMASLPQRRYVGGGADAGETTRHLVHKLPIFLAGDPPIPHFVWLETDVREEGCASFLRAHAPLLASLPAWALVAASPLSTSCTASGLTRRQLPPCDPWLVPAGAFGTYLRILRLQPWPKQNRWA